MIDAITCRRVALECYAQVFDTVTLCRGWRVVEGRIAVDEDAMLPLRAAEEVGRSVIPCRGRSWSVCYSVPRKKLVGLLFRAAKLLVAAR